MLNRITDMESRMLKCHTNRSELFLRAKCVQSTMMLSITDRSVPRAIPDIPMNRQNMHESTRLPSRSAAYEALQVPVSPST